KGEKKMKKEKKEEEETEEEDWAPIRTRSKRSGKITKRESMGTKRVTRSSSAAKRKRGREKVDKCPSTPEKPKKRRRRRVKVESSSGEEEDEEEDTEDTKEADDSGAEEDQPMEADESINEKTRDSSQEVPQDPIQQKDQSEKKATVSAAKSAAELARRKRASTPKSGASTSATKMTDASALPSSIQHLFDETIAAPSPSLSTFRVPKKKETTGSTSSKDHISPHLKVQPKVEEPQEKPGWDPRDTAFHPKPRAFLKPTERPAEERKRPVDFHRHTEAKTPPAIRRFDFASFTQSPMEQNEPTFMETPPLHRPYLPMTPLSALTPPTERKSLERFNDAYKQIVKTPSDLRPHLSTPAQSHKATVSRIQSTLDPRGAPKSILKTRRSEPMEPIDNSIDFGTPSAMGTVGRAEGEDGGGGVNEERRESGSSSSWMPLASKSPVNTASPSIERRSAIGFGMNSVSPMMNQFCPRTPAPAYGATVSAANRSDEGSSFGDPLPATPRVIPVESINAIRYRFIPLDDLPPLFERKSLDAKERDSSEQVAEMKCRAVLAAGPFVEKEGHENFINYMKEKGVDVEWTTCPDTKDVEEMKVRTIAALICYSDKVAKSLLSDGGTVVIDKEYISIGKPSETIVTMMGLNPRAELGEEEMKKELTDAIETQFGRLVELSVLSFSDVYVEAKARFFWAVHASRAIHGAPIVLRDNRHITTTVCPPDRSTAWICETHSDAPKPALKKLVVSDAPSTTVPQPVPPPTSLVGGVSIPPLLSLHHSSKFSLSTTPTSLPPPGLIDPVSLRPIALHHQQPQRGRPSDSKTSLIEKTLSIPPIRLPPSINIPLPPAHSSFAPSHPHHPLRIPFPPTTTSTPGRRFLLPTPSHLPVPVSQPSVVPVLHPSLMPPHPQPMRTVDPATFIKPFEALLPKKMEIEEKLARAKAEREKKESEKRKREKEERKREEEERDEDEILLIARCFPPLTKWETFTNEECSAVREFFMDEDCSSRIFGGNVSLRFTGRNAREKAQVLLLDSPIDIEGIRGRHFTIGTTHSMTFEASAPVSVKSVHGGVAKRFPSVVEVEKKSGNIFKIYFEKADEARSERFIKLDDALLRLVE
ncbi:hypothetical protein PFISCL1PPCAC_23435, partial [Pristionchus fissidentatus]